MRIGLVIGQLGYGGAERQLYELARSMHREHEVFVYSLSDRLSPFGDALLAQGVSVRALPARRSFDLQRVHALRRCIETDRLEVLHAFLYIASAYAYLATPSYRGVRLVTSARNCKPEPNVLRRTIIRRAFRRSHAVICNSRTMAAFAVHYYRAPQQRVHVVYNGIDVSQYASCRTTTARPGNAYTIGTIGRLERQKNLDMFLAAAARVRKQLPQARFRILGEGSERARLEALSERLGLGTAVQFEGTRSDVASFLTELDQFWLTSDWEGTPNVVLEAMAAKVPVIATRVGGTPELIRSGESGMLVEPGDLESLARIALELAADSVRAGRLAERAFRDVEDRFSVVRMVEETYRIYRTALEAAA